MPTSNLDQNGQPIIEGGAQPTIDPSVQSTQPTSTIEFDVNNLPPDFQRYLDQERTRASQTASKKARENLLRDEGFLNEVRGQVAPAVQKTVEEEMKMTLAEVRMDRSRAKVEQILGTHVPREQVDFYVNQFATEDTNASIEKATLFVTQLEETKKTWLSQQKVQNINNMTTPTQGANNLNETTILQKQLDEARASKTSSARANMSRILRVAQEKGITLK